MMNPRSLRWLAVAALACFCACARNPEPDGASPPPTGSPTATATSKAPAPPGPAGPSGPQRPAQVTWDAPPAFEKASNTSPMRKASYRVKHVGSDPEDGDLSVSQAGGTVEMNIQRWDGQFTDKTGKDSTKRFERMVGDLKVAVVEIHGTFAGSGMPGAPAAAPKPRFMLLGAIVDTAVPTFFKLTGPEKTITAARPDFDKLVDSLRVK